VNWTDWRAPVTDACSTAGENQSGTCDSGFDQDAGSSFNEGGGPVLLAFAADPATVGLNETTMLTASVVGGVGPLSYAYAGLPPGCATANASTLACTPRSDGTFPIELSVTDSAGNDASGSVTLLVLSMGVPTAPPTPEMPPPNSDWELGLAIGLGSTAVVAVGLVLWWRRRSG
jgi:hypothetical protein